MCAASSRQGQNMKLAAPLDGKIDEVATALKLTLEFEAQLHDSGGRSVDYVHRMVLQLEEKLALLRSKRVSKIGNAAR